MAEYICREAIIDDFEKEIEAGNAALDEDVWINKGLRIAIRDIKDIKTADVQPVKHGKWLSHHAIWIDQPKIEGWFVQAKCSECEKWAHVMNPYTKSVDYECCPHCGVRMDGDVE